MLSHSNSFGNNAEKDTAGCRAFYRKSIVIEEKFMELKFEWDEEKDRINRQKHGISFETASYVFRDEYYIEMYDFEHSMEEDRYIAIGMVGDLLFVVFTERGENIRLISARLATESESPAKKCQ